MKKEYRKWHEKKSVVNAIVRRPFFHEREIWFCAIGVNVGFEQDGAGGEFQRPVIVIRKFNNEIFWTVPLTKAAKKRKKKAEKYYYSFSFVPGITSVALLSQLRIIDARRLSRHIGFIGRDDFGALMKKLKALLP